MKIVLYLVILGMGWAAFAASSGSNRDLDESAPVEWQVTDRQPGGPGGLIYVTLTNRNTLIVRKAYVNANDIRKFWDGEEYVIDPPKVSFEY